MVIMMKRLLSVVIAVLVCFSLIVPAFAADSKTEPVEIVETTHDGEHEDWTENEPSTEPTDEEASEATEIPEDQISALWTVDYETEEYPAEVTIEAPGTDGLPVYVLELIDGAWVVIGSGTGPIITVTVEQGGTISVVTQIPILYEVTEGMGGVWYQTTTDPLPFTCVRNIDDPSAYSHFTGIEVDGATIDPANYTAVSGSVVLNLHADYLATLALGEHQLMYRFDDGQAGTNFFVRPISERGTYPDKDTTAKAPKTGDNALLMAAAVVMTLAAGGALTLTRRKEH